MTEVEKPGLALAKNADMSGIGKNLLRWQSLQ
jgi:hypothetical protein